MRFSLVSSFEMLSDTVTPYCTVSNVSIFLEYFRRKLIVS